MAPPRGEVGSLTLTLTLTLKASHQLKLDATGKNVFAVLRHVGR